MPIVSTVFPKNGFITEVENERVSGRYGGFAEAEETLFGEAMETLGSSENTSNTFAKIISILTTPITFILDAIVNLIAMMID